MVIRARLMYKHEPNTETRRNVMPTHEEAIHTDVESLNKLSVASLVLSMVALVGLWFFGLSGLAIFAVGAGHVALNQIAHSGGKGRWLAIFALVIGYGIGVLALVSVATAIPAIIQSYVV